MYPSGWGRNMKLSWRSWSIFLLIVSLYLALKADGNCYPAIFNFGDDDGDTGGMHASFPNTTTAEAAPYGQTFFGYPTGRNSDGRLIIDFIAEAFGFRFLDPYLQSVTSDFSQGVNFATWAAVARTGSYLSSLSLFPLHTQVQQFQLFQTEVLEVLNGTTSVLASNGLLGKIDDSAKQPYKELYNDLFNNSAAANDSSIIAPQKSTDNDVLIALQAAARLPLASSFAQGLYLISIGTNDIKYGIVNNDSIPTITAYLPNVTAALTTAVQNLYSAGARNIVVAGVGTMGCSPSLLAVLDYTVADLDSFGCLADYNTLARTHNTLLQQGLATLNPQLPGASVTFLDIYQMQHDLLFNYSQNGLVAAIQACCGVPSTYNYDPQVVCGESAVIANVLTAAVTCPDPSSYADWDGIHYTDAANQYFARQIFSGQYFSPPFQLFSTNCTAAPF